MYIILSEFNAEVSAADAGNLKISFGMPLGIFEAGRLSNVGSGIEEIVDWGEDDRLCDWISESISRFETMSLNKGVECVWFKGDDRSAL